MSTVKEDSIVKRNIQATSSMYSDRSSLEAKCCKHSGPPRLKTQTALRYNNNNDSVNSRRSPTGSSIRFCNVPRVGRLKKKDYFMKPYLLKNNSKSPTLDEDDRNMRKADPKLYEHVQSYYKNI